MTNFTQIINKNASKIYFTTSNKFKRWILIIKKLIENISDILLFLSKIVISNSVTRKMDSMITGIETHN